MQSNLVPTGIGMRAVEKAAIATSPNDEIGNLLVHADWIESYVKTSRLPGIQLEQSAVAGRIVEAA